MICFSPATEMPSFFLFCRYLNIWFCKSRLNILQCQETRCFQRCFSFAFWVWFFIFFPSQHDKLLQSFTKVTFSSRTLHLQKIQIPVEHLHLGWHQNSACEGSPADLSVLNTACLEQQSSADISPSFYRDFLPPPCGISIPAGGEAVSHLGTQHRAAEPVKSDLCQNSEILLTTFLTSEKSELWACKGIFRVREEISGLNI